MFESPKAKKKAILARNKRHQKLYYHVKEIQRQAKKRKEAEEKAHAKSKHREDEEEPVWSAKMQIIRNRLDDGRRMSKERWNRFAGTDESGGRGL